MQVILADNQAIFCAGIFRVLTAEPAIRVVAQCADIDQAKEAIRSSERSIVVFPSSITGDLHGLIDCIKKAGAASVMIVEQDVTLEESIKQRLDGMILRSVSSRQLVDCLYRVSAGSRYTQPGMVKTLMFPGARGAKGAQRLTPRELQIVALISEGCRNREIADQLGSKEQVVKNHLRSIYGKMGVSDRLELALVTVRHSGLAEMAEAARLSLGRSA